MALTSRIPPLRKKIELESYRQEIYKCKMVTSERESPRRKMD